MTTESTIVAKVLPGKNGAGVGSLMLNMPKTLNSLTLEMVDLLQHHLDLWQHDDAVGGVFIYAAGEKAFCAGGDVQALHRSAVEQPGGPCEYAETFFANEYRMNHTLHNYAKPIVCWGHGIVMGGGLGVFAGCSHKVVTERTRFGMPEITIALFPDVGGSYFLNRMPGKVGRFLALTAANFNGNDGIDNGFGNAMLPNAARDEFLQAMQALPFETMPSANHQLLSDLLVRLAREHDCDAPEGFIASRRQQIDELFSGDILDVYKRLQEFDSGDDEWLGKARAGLMHGSPLAVLWIDRQLSLAANMTLGDVFRSELLLGTNIVRHPEFAEGVRALLIDKDREPDWQFKNPEAVPADLLDSFFAPPWDSNPLADL